MNEIFLGLQDYSKVFNRTAVLIATIILIDFAVGDFCNLLFLTAGKDNDFISDNCHEMVSVILLVGTVFNFSKSVFNLGRDA